jgi:hypothetical protein
MDGAWPSRFFTKPQYEYINELAWKKNFIAVLPKGTVGACNIGKDNKYLLYFCWETKNDTDRQFLTLLKNTVISQYKANPDRDARCIYDYSYRKDNSRYLWGYDNTCCISYWKEII